MANQSYQENVPVLYVLGFPKGFLHSYNSVMEGVLVTVHIFGVLSNIPVLIVFYKNSLTSSSNVCFFSLAVTDLYISAFFVLKRGWDIAISRGHFSHVNAYKDLMRYSAHSTDAMKSVGAWITAVINLERLLCIYFPLKVG